MTKHYVKQERLFISEQRNFIDNCDPNNFWDFIKKIGPKRPKTCESVTLENGTESFDREEIRQKWKRDFEQLFNERLDVDGDI